MSFLGKLAEQISSQYSLGENTNNTLDSIDPITGKQEKYGSLGDLASKIDQSAQRKYVEEGYLKRDPYNTDVKQFEILMQEPSATLLVKKRMYTSVAENFRPDFMDKDEKLYYKSMNILFQNKCNQISALERLSKLQKFSSNVGKFDAQLMPVIFSLTDVMSNSAALDAGADQTSGLGVFSSTNPFFKNGGSDFIKVVDRLRKIYAFNSTNYSTSWITDPMNLFQSQLGLGTGVIEITNFNNLRTSVNVNSIQSAGTFDISIMDPYEASLITEWDIEKAISDATNSFYSNKSYQFGKSSLEQIIAQQTLNLNSLRRARGVSSIKIIVSANTLLGKRVRAICEKNGLEFLFTYDSSGGTGFPGLGGFSSDSVQISDDYLIGGILGGEGLNTKNNIAPSNSEPASELSLFKSIISGVFNKMQMEANSQGAFQTTNSETNYARRKLRYTFAGQFIVQPMDTVHIYMSSKSRYDNKLLSGLNNMFSGNGILQNLNKTATDFRNTFDLAFNPGNMEIQAEKAAYVGPDFPNYLWSILRSQFVTENEGVHTFGGVVNSTRDSWSGGSFSLSLSGQDNTYYFDQGRTNFQPGCDTFNGSFFDPLTPFKTNFDTINYNTDNEAPNLLEENKYLLSPTGQEDKNTIVKFKFGPFAGSPATSENTQQDQGIDPISGLLTKTYYAPDGLVYKWKEGIGVFVQFGSSLSLNDPSRTGQPNTYKDAFAGQDIMNVLSLLITGQPYNFATYWKTAVRLYGFSGDPQTNQNSVHSFLTSLREDLKKNNALWGNFLPFKNLVVSEAAYAQALQTSFDINKKNTQIESGLKRIQELNLQAQMLGYSGIEQNAGENYNVDDMVKLQAQKEELYKEIDKNLTEITKQSEQQNWKASLNNDPTYDYTDFVETNNPKQDMSDPKTRRYLRRQLNYLTRRMSYNVRANEDKNLFIVDDYYDKDYDILAYDQALNGAMPLYQNTFLSVRNKIQATADLLNLEVFCDTQGHIRVRPPQYNRMPSSIFRRMMYLKQSLGIQIFPDFLNNLFNNQLEALKQRVEILEDNIRLYCAVLNNNDDQTAIKFISSSGSDDNSGDIFAFISNPEGNINNITTLLNSANPDGFKTDDNSYSLISSQSNPKKPLFSNSQRYNVIVNELKKVKYGNEGFSIGDPIQFKNNSTIDKLIARIQLKSGQRINRDMFVLNLSDVNSSYELPAIFTINIVEITKHLSAKIRERQSVLKLFFNSLKNAVEFKSLDDKNDNTGSQLLTPTLYGNQEVPDVFEHMVEDETYDDYGVGSGSRYIIRRPQIISVNIGVNAPDYNFVQVNGYINTYVDQGNQAPSLEVPGVGNGMTSATAVDYDSWRSYGLKTTNPVNVPFLNDVNTQCAPYAAMLLSRARKNIIRGSVTIVGNEYMQPGEVVYLEDRGLLFYVTGVSHQFTYGAAGGTFHTSLELSYGHTPGDYIPTTMDIIGKLLYNNQSASNYIIQRQSSATNDISMGALLLNDLSNPAGSLPITTDNSNGNPTLKFNEKIINNILFTAANVINSRDTSGSNARAEVQLRIYKNKTYNSNPDGLKTFAEYAKNMLQDDHPANKYTAGTNASYTNPPLGKNTVSIVEVDMDEVHSMSPSQKAMDLARNNLNLATSSSQASSIDSPSQEHDRLALSLFEHVVDCWITFVNVDKTPSTKGSA